VTDWSNYYFTISTGGSPGSILVSSNPVGAEIYLDGVKVLKNGQPLKTTTSGALVSTAPGTHTVWLTLKDYLDEAQSFTLPSGTQNKAVTFTLDSSSGTSGGKNSADDDTGRMVITSVYGAETWIDGELKGTAPYEREIIPGTDWDHNYPHVYNVKVKAFGYTPEEGVTKPVKVGRGWIVNEDFTAELTRAPWSILTFKGFFTPIKMDQINEINTRHVSALPIKWNLTDANGEYVSNPALIEGIKSYEIDCAAPYADKGNGIADEVASGDSGLKYNGYGQWQFNMKINQAYAGQCRNIYAQFILDQKSPDVTFSFT
jgi:hypothetical protein